MKVHIQAQEFAQLNWGKVLPSGSVVRDAASAFCRAYGLFSLHCRLLANGENLDLNTPLQQLDPKGTGVVKLDAIFHSSASFAVWQILSVETKHPAWEDSCKGFVLPLLSHLLPKDSDEDVIRQIMLVHPRQLAYASEKADLPTDYCVQPVALPCLSWALQVLKYAQQGFDGFIEFAEAAKAAASDSAPQIIQLQSAVVFEDAKIGLGVSEPNPQETLGDICKMDPNCYISVSYLDHIVAALLMMKLSLLVAAVRSDSLETCNAQATLWSVIATFTDSLRQQKYASIDSCSEDDVSKIQRLSLMLVQLLLRMIRQAIKDSSQQAFHSIELLHVLLLSPFKPVGDSIAAEIIDAGGLVSLIAALEGKRQAAGEACRVLLLLVTKQGFECKYRAIRLVSRMQGMRRCTALMAPYCPPHEVRPDWVVKAFPAEPPPVTSATYVDSAQEWLENLRVCLKFLLAMLIAAPLSDHTERPWQCDFQSPYNLATASGADDFTAAVAAATDGGSATPHHLWSRTIAGASKAAAALVNAAEAIDAATAATATATELRDRIISQQQSNPSITPDDAAAIKAAVAVAENCAAAAHAAFAEVRPFSKLTSILPTAPNADASSAAADAAAAPVASNQQPCTSGSPSSADASPASAAAPGTELVSSRLSSSPATASGTNASPAAAAPAPAASSQQPDTSGSPSSADASPASATPPDTAPINSQLSSSPATTSNADASPAADAAAPAASSQQPDTSGSPSSADASTVSAAAPDTVPVSSQPSSSPTAAPNATAADTAADPAPASSTQQPDNSASPSRTDASPVSAAAPNTVPVSSQPSSSPALASGTDASPASPAADAAAPVASSQQPDTSGNPSSGDASPASAAAPNTEPISSQPSSSPATSSNTNALPAAATAAAVNTAPAGTQPFSSSGTASDSDELTSAADAVIRSIQQEQHALSQGQPEDTKRDGTKLPAVIKGSTFLPQENLDHTPLWPTPSAAAWADIEVIASRTAVTLEWLLSKVFCDGKSQIAKQLKDLASIIVQLNSVLHIITHGHIADPKLGMSAIFWPLLRAATQNIVSFGCHVEIANDLILALMSRKAVDKGLFDLKGTMIEESNWANRMLLLCCIAGMHKRPQLLTAAAQAVHEALTPAGTCHHMLSTQEQSLQLVVQLSFDLVQADDTTKLAMCACIARLACLDAQIRGAFVEDSVLYPTAIKANLFPTWRQLVITFIQAPAPWNLLHCLGVLRMLHHCRDLAETPLDKAQDSKIWEPREEMANIGMQLALRVQDLTSDITLQRQLLYEAIRWTEMPEGIVFKEEGWARSLSALVVVFHHVPPQQPLSKKQAEEQMWSRVNLGVTEPTQAELLRAFVRCILTHGTLPVSADSVTDYQQFEQIAMPILVDDFKTMAGEARFSQEQGTNYDERLEHAHVYFYVEGQRILQHKSWTALLANPAPPPFVMQQIQSMMQFIYLMIVRLDEHYTAARQLKVARLKQAQENIRLRQLAEDEEEESQDALEAGLRAHRLVQRDILMNTAHSATLGNNIGQALGNMELAYGQAEWLCCIEAVAASEWGLKSYKTLKPLLEKPMMSKLAFAEPHFPATIAFVHKLFNPDEGAGDVSEAVGNLLVTDEELSSARAEVHAASKKARKLRHKQRKRLEKQNQQLSPDSSDRLTPRDLSQTDNYGGMSPEQRQQADEETQFLHKLFCCPITQVFMVDPVIAADGHTYERAALEQHLLRHKTSPVTGAQLAHQRLVPNLIVKQAIAKQQQALL